MVFNILAQYFLNINFKNTYIIKQLASRKVMADKLMEPLLDPLGDRIVKNVTPPPHRPLYSENIFAPAGTDFKDPKAPLFVDWKLIMKNF